jgi:uncharacterized protein (UPF0179 family)
MKVKDSEMLIFLRENKLAETGHSFICKAYLEICQECRSNSIIIDNEKRLKIEKNAFNSTLCPI